MATPDHRHLPVPNDPIREIDMPARLQRLYWQLTALLLAAHFTGWAWALPAAMALTAWQSAHCAWARGTLQALGVQVRVGYLGLLLLGSVGPLWPIHVVQFVGVNALLVVDYCLLARLLVLMPWNRIDPLSMSLVGRALFTPPAPGAIHQLMNLRLRQERC